MEAVLGAKRDSWPVSTIRRLADALIEVAAGRKKSPRHEMRWLNLSGFCLRPGFGAPGDDVRVNRLRTIASNKLAFADDLQCQVGALVLLRRIAGGIHANEQIALYRNHTSPSGSKKKRINRQLEYEKWRLLGNLEHLQASIRASLGRELLAKVRKEPGDAIWLWSLGPTGCSHPPVWATALGGGTRNCQRVAESSFGLIHAHGGDGFYCRLDRAAHRRSLA